MPALNGLEAAGRLATASPATRVLILSMHNAEESVLRALRSGCAGYLLKGSAVSELEIAVRAVAEPPKLRALARRSAAGAARGVRQT
jgi:DNA-binding NarL/FixJ family response regulator